METTAVDQAEKIRLGFGAGPESGRGGVLGTRLPTLSGGGGAEMQRGLRFNVSGLDRYESQSLFAFGQTTWPSLPWERG